MRTTLQDPTKIVHAVDVAEVPPGTPGTASVAVRAVCGAGGAQYLPASLAVQTSAVRFTGRVVTCEACQ